LTEDGKALQDRVRIAQEAVFRSVKKGTWEPREDRKVRDEFSKLEERFRYWAKAYAMAEIGDLEYVSTAKKNEIVSHLEGYCIQDDWEVLVQRMPVFIRKRIPVLFAQAMLAKDIFDKMFARPFLPFAEHNNTPALPCAADMATLYQEMMNGKP
jgi:hypothetical protein